MFAIAWFEFKTKLSRLSTYVYFGIFTAIAALWMAAAGGAFASANIIFSSDKVFINSPFAISQTVSILGLLGTVLVAAFMGRAVQQDFEYQTFHFFFTSPIAKRDYVFGRYIGAIAILVFIFLGISLGILIGSAWPGVDPTRIGPWSLAAFAKPYFVILLPNLVFLGAVFFGIAALTRRMLPVYVAGVITLIGYLAGLPLLRDIDNKMLASLVDPIGSAALSLVTRYWSPAEKNSQLVPLTDELLWNRLLWTTVGLAIFGLCYWRFRMAFSVSERKRKTEVVDDEKMVPRTIFSVAATVDLRASAYFRSLPGLVRLLTRETMKNVYFASIVLAGALFIFANAKTVGSLYGTNTYPVTYQVLDFASGSFGIFMLIITTLYAGELVWRERDAQMALIADSAPTPTWLPFLAKLLTLMTVQAALQVVVMICGILVQLFSGYTKLELGQYLYRLFLLQLPEYWMFAALALTIHTVVNHKYLGHFLVIVYFVADITSASFGYDHHLYRFGETPPLIYSDMNRYGHFLGPIRWFQLYWAAAAVLLLVAARLFWVRGTDTNWKVRLRMAKERWSPPLTATAIVASAIFIGTGAWIFYNTNILNPYRTEFTQKERQADYERNYKAAWTPKPQPKITAVKVNVDIFPHEHRIRFAGQFTAKNKSEAPIPELFVNVREGATINKIAASIPLKTVEERRDLNVMRFALEHPLAPGETMTFDFDFAYPRPGFTNNGAHSIVVDNGTFVNSSYLPTFGYEDRAELTEDRDRKKHNLGPRERVRDIDDPWGRQRNYISGDGDWIDFEATVVTDPDQIALAPGYLQSDRTENGRRYFHYKMDVPILNFYAFLSARYAVKKEAWNAIPIEIYYQPGHEYDLDAMFAGVKDSLDYYTKYFSPYQHKQVRILEFPRYAAFAQSFPNTIPYSESIGFIAKVDPKDPKDIDYPYYVTAHEIAHQWWAHQVIGAYVQGSTMMSETLAQYSALMVMKKKYGDAKMKRFLKYELDSYLVGRGTERKKEQPLYRNENQPYIHYRKGSIAMYAFQDAIGEENVNRALAAYIKKFAYQEPPYTTARDLIAEFRAVTPPQYQYFVTDLFETITLWENRAISATYKDKGNGKYDVTVKVSAKKVRADEDGKQTEVPMDDLVDIGVLGADDAPLYLKKHRVKTGETTFTVEVAGKPIKAGIDPVIKLIDRRPDDNVVSVSAQ
jgi:ABC-2 type transport system permease protein